jgi:5-methylcytosine-specific restriction endonuclease McrA
MKLYETTRWRKKREHILKRDKYQCQHYKRYGKNIDANTVHHIYPVSEYPEYTWCDWNLISLSQQAHDMMHDRVTGKLTALGEELKRKTIPPPSHC